MKWLCDLVTGAWIVKCCTGFRWDYASLLIMYVWSNDLTSPGHLNGKLLNTTFLKSRAVLTYMGLVKQIQKD